MSPSYPYPRAPLFPKPKIQTLEKIYTNHHIPIPTLISLYPHTTFMVRRLILHGDMHRLIYRAMCKLSIPIHTMATITNPLGLLSQIQTHEKNSKSVKKPIPMTGFKIFQTCTRRVNRYPCVTHRYTILY